ncbi:MAG: TIGR02757 family protein [Bacteroidales bacterium]
MTENLQIREYLEEKVVQYNQPSFIPLDPIQVPHRFIDKEDIEIAAFLTATIAWGQRKTIINNAGRLIGMMPGGPYNFLMEYKEDELTPFLSFVHRTFNGFDCHYFLRALRSIYLDHGGLEKVFMEGYKQYGDMFGGLVRFRSVFFSNGDPGRTSRHISDVTSNSAAKRLNMFLRWMVREDAQGVDFGLWKQIPMSALYIPLDIHSGNSARKLKLLRRRQDDWKAVTELTGVLREFDPEDPVKYDYALFGLGVFEKF